MKILLFVDQLYLGGAGRVASILVSALEKRGYQITVVYDKSFGLTYPDKNCQTRFDYSLLASYFC